MTPYILATSIVLKPAVIDCMSNIYKRWTLDNGGDWMLVGLVAATLIECAYPACKYCKFLSNLNYMIARAKEFRRLEGEQVTRAENELLPNYTSKTSKKLLKCALKQYRWAHKPFRVAIYNFTG